MLRIWPTILLLLMSWQASGAEISRLTQINELLNWAEGRFSQLFPSHAQTLQFDVWTFRYYPRTDNYAGVNTAGDAYVLGPGFGGLKRVETLENLLSVAGLDNGIGAIDRYRILANNDLGMHCADRDLRIFSILPPYNVVHAQVLEKGSRPRLLSPADGIGVEYLATTSNLLSSNENLPPIATDSITTSGKNGGVHPVYKSNFWARDHNGDILGALAYDPLYPPSVLDGFDLSPDRGLPAPDLVELYLGSGSLQARQATMPGLVSTPANPYARNEPQPFHAYVEDLPFFTDFPFGYRVRNFHRFIAEGIPVPDVDDAGRENPYPLLRVQAKDARGKVIARVDTVVPVSSEADCQVCHASQAVCDLDSGNGLACDDIANFRYSSVDFIEDARGVIGASAHEKVVNAAKINILKLHDFKHGTHLAPERNDGTNADGSTPNLVCAKCHYSPALDLAHLGPSDANGKQQTRHISMSAAMHGFHGNLPRKDPADYGHLFPIMPPPNQRDPGSTQQLLYDSCYNCHPGRKAKCLRGAMAGAGIVCQDCHGQMTQIGNDFSLNFPTTAGAVDLGKRVPWASEPNCQSCHVGDELQVRALKTSGQLNDALFNDSDRHGNPDGLRLKLAYALGEHSANGGDDQLVPFDFSQSRFAANEPLYRLSGGGNDRNLGHGGLSCEGCHGSTHAIWPNRNPYANDNRTATDIQGHAGTISECGACHDGDLGETLRGPHGMHMSGDSNFANGGHEEIAERNLDACRACHGTDLRGSVLSRAAADRTLYGGRVQVRKNEPVGCGLCHTIPSGGEGGDGDRDGGEGFREGSAGDLNGGDGLQESSANSPNSGDGLRESGAGDLNSGVNGQEGFEDEGDD